MNDNDLLTEVRDSFTGVRSATPVERIVSRSRAVRARRRIPAIAVAGTLAAAAAVALGVTTAQPTSHVYNGPEGQLAAWTVAKQADGSIRVTLHELRDPAGLQRTLRTDGVPVSVTFTGQQNPACQPYPGPDSQDERRLLLPSVAGGDRGGPDVLVIHPSALPPGAGLQVSAAEAKQQGFLFAVRLIQASPQCTGSQAPS